LQADSITTPFSPADWPGLGGCPGTRLLQTVTTAGRSAAADGSGHALKAAIKIETRIPAVIPAERDRFRILLPFPRDVGVSRPLNGRANRTN
jgi:hypothetical protein